MLPPPQADFAAALRDPSPRRRLRRRTLRDLSQQPDGGADRSPRRDLSRDRAHRRRGILPRDGNEPSSPRIRRASPVLHEYGAANFRTSSRRSSRRQALPYLAMSRGSNGPGCAPITPRIMRHWRPYRLQGFADDDLPNLTVQPASLAGADPLALSGRHDLADECEGGTPTEIGHWQAENVLVVRPQLDVLVRIVPDETAAFLAALSSGLPLAMAAAAARKPPRISICPPSWPAPLRSA